MKKNIYFIISLLFVSFLWVGNIKAGGLIQGETAQQLNENMGYVQSGAGYEGASLGQVLGTVIQGFLGLLGMIFIILMLIAGYNWMTAAGDEEKIKKATSNIRSAIIGLIIIVAAYAITYFVFSAIDGLNSGQPWPSNS
ncbi:MAG: pilin [Patescibacteria group bacterium]|nr:MAG: pilin [Patescibacteria group bacterium]